LIIHLKGNQGQTYNVVENLNAFGIQQHLKLNDNVKVPIFESNNVVVIVIIIKRKKNRVVMYEFLN
jgi:hypothetical protein